MAGDLAIRTLTELISIQSFSKEEHNAAPVIEKVLTDFGYTYQKKGNNVWVKSKDFAEDRPTLMLNSHIDTVKPALGWTTDPFKPVLEHGKLTGLGSNDAGGSLVSLLATFLMSENLNLEFNRVFVASAEEEISGKGGIESILPYLDFVDVGIVGEPTQMEMAVAEKGLMVLDCEVKGKAGHAARTGGVNAITEAMKEIEWFHSFQFPKVSDTLGPVKMTVTVINAGKQHNVIPDTCTFVVDVRLNDHYLNVDALEIIQKGTQAKVTPRSTRMNSSGINPNHPVVKAADKLGIVKFGSPTTSDQAIITIFPTIKMGPGDSNRSHTANEHIYLDEIKEGIKIYCDLLREIQF
ncbi:MAG: M20 family metallo-hydrolase [Salinivirgaceae bacterium]|nr:M20 family metallo-hydrolase [Salinivirgaceae bacterium]